MAFNPYMNNPYLQPYYQPVMQQPMVQQPVQQTIHQNPQTNVIWVSNESEARNYPVSPGNTVMLMDNDNPVVYKKSSDLSGRSLPLEVYDLVKREAEPPKEENHQIDLTEYLTRREFDSYASEVDKRFSEINTYEEEDTDEEEEEEVKPVRRRKGKR